MIIDLQRFVAVERPHWSDLEKMLAHLEAEPNATLPLDKLTRFHELYERASADLAKLTTFSSEPETRRYLENLVSRAYGEIHETRERRTRLAPMKWFFQTLPQTFRRHIRAFQLTVAITIAGCAFGGASLMFDPESRHATMAFGHDQLTPEERVRQEEESKGERLSGQKTSFSAYLMTHNTRVSIFTLALGMTWGVGTIISLFYNGVIMGSISVDYIQAGQTKFLLGWLLPHGVIEIPAILIAGQAGLVLAGALIGWGKRTPLTARLRAVSRDLATLIFGVAILLVWAGFVEAFFSQYHAPVLPYEVKIAFGLVELGLLWVFLAKSGSSHPDSVAATRESAAIPTENNQRRSAETPLRETK
ncbi:MAG: stage II sporulation protein M [Verrucomicrobia bacterium]|nr:MAG: stage II sporulation protein M [Verrucomicrobiota bacterium]